MKVLIIRFSSIGDIVLTSPVVRCVKLQLNAEVHYLTKEVYRELLEFSPYIDKLFSIHHSVNEVLPILRKQKYDLIIDLHQNPRSWMVALRLGVRRLGFDKLHFAKWARVHLKLDLLPKVHLVDRYFAALRGINVVNDGKGLDFFLRPRQDVQQTGAPTCVAVLGATHATKRIPLLLWQKIMDRVNLPAVLLGGPAESNLGDQLQRMFPDKCTNLAGKLSLQQSAEYIATAQFVITPDTGMMHIAAAFNKPIHVFWGSTIPEFGMFPYYPSGVSKAIHNQVMGLECRPCSKLGFARCPRGHFKCMLDQIVPNDWMPSG